MTPQHISRRDVLVQGSMAVAGLALLRTPGLAHGSGRGEGHPSAPRSEPDVRN